MTKQVKEYRKQLLAMLDKHRINYMDGYERVFNEAIEVVENFIPVNDKDFEIGQRHYALIKQGVRVQFNQRSRMFDVIHIQTGWMLSAVSYKYLGPALNEAEKIVKRGRYKLNEEDYE